MPPHPYPRDEAAGSTPLAGTAAGTFLRGGQSADQMVGSDPVVLHSRRNLLLPIWIGWNRVQMHLTVFADVPAAQAAVYPIEF